MTVAHHLEAKCGSRDGADKDGGESCCNNGDDERYCSNHNEYGDDYYPSDD